MSSAAPSSAPPPASTVPNAASRAWLRSQAARVARQESEHAQGIASLEATTKRLRLGNEVLAASLAARGSR